MGVVSWCVGGAHVEAVITWGVVGNVIPAAMEDEVKRSEEDCF